MDKRDLWIINELFYPHLDNDFLEEVPKGQQIEATAFKTYDNFKTYAWELYNVFFGYATSTGQTDEIFRGDYEADNMIKHVADETINELRVRANVSPMTVSTITSSFDTNRDITVDPILWGIRRECRVELMREGFRLDDLRR